MTPAQQPSLSDKLIKSQKPAPPKIILYGPPGIGKTTFAATAGATLLDCENGAGSIPDLIRTPYCATWPEMREWLVLWATMTDPPKTIAVDTLDWLCRRVIEHVTIDMDPKDPGDLTNSVGGSHGGFFKARDIIKNLVFREVLPLFNQINARGTVIILLAHAVNAEEKTPEGTSIRRAAPDLPDIVSAAFVEWADAILYCHRANDRSRIIRTEETNIVLAKNRYGLSEVMPLDWSAILDSIRHFYTTPER